MSPLSTQILEEKSVYDTRQSAPEALEKLFWTLTPRDANIHNRWSPGVARKGHQYRAGARWFYFELANRFKEAVEATRVQG